MHTGRTSARAPQVTGIEPRDVAVRDVSPREAEQWRALASIASDPNPFSDPDFLIPSVSTHPQARDARLLTVWRGDNLIAVMPYARAERRIGPLRLRTASSSASFSAFEGERFHPLIAPGEAHAAVQGLLRGARSLGCAALEFGRIRTGSELHHAIEAARERGVAVLREAERSFVRAGRQTIGADATEGPFPTQHLSTSARKRLRRMAGAIAKHGPLTLHDDSALPRAVDAFLELQNAGWKGDADADGKAFVRTGLDAWFRSVCESFRDHDKLVLLSLRAGGDVVFTTVALRSGRGAFGFHDAYATEFRAFSPGALGRLAEIRAVLRLPDIDFFDPSMDDSKYPQVTGLYPDDEGFSTFLMATRISSGLAIRLAPLARAVKARVSRPRERADSP